MHTELANPLNVTAWLCPARTRMAYTGRWRRSLLDRATIPFSVDTFLGGAP